MIIANPIYDVVFKYLMDDTEIAQELMDRFQTTDPYQMDFRGSLDEPLVKKMVDRLGRAIANEDMCDRMDVEDEVYKLFSEKDAIIDMERQRAEQEKARADDLQRQLDELKKQQK
jgi:hypothetical protein